MTGATRPPGRRMAVMLTRTRAILDASLPPIEDWVALGRTVERQAADGGRDGHCRL